MLTLQDPPPRFSFHQRVFSMWSFPSSCSFKIASLMAVLYGESEVPRSFWGTPSRLLLSPHSVVLSRNFRKYRCGNRSLALTFCRQYRARSCFLHDDTCYRPVFSRSREISKDRQCDFIRSLGISVADKPTSSCESLDARRERFAFSFYQNFICVKKKF